MQQLVLPSDQGWPRSSYGMGVQPQGRGTPVLVAFEQASAREQYKLWGYVQLLPSVTMPRFAEAALGSPAVAPDDTSLKVAPATVIEQYASVLSVDGGALVLGALASQETVRAEENWQLGPPTPSARALWGDAERTNVVRIVYRDMVALYVPPAGSSAPVTLVGYHRVPHTVSND